MPSTTRWTEALSERSSMCLAAELAALKVGKAGIVTEIGAALDRLQYPASLSGSTMGISPEVLLESRTSSNKGREKAVMGATNRSIRVREG